MSKTDLEGFDTPDVSDSDGSKRIDLDPGDHLSGQIVNANLGAGSHGVIEIGELDDDGEVQENHGELWLNRTMRRQLEAALLVGAPIAHVKSDEEDSFENEDGEEQTFYPRELRFKQ